MRTTLKMAAKMGNGFLMKLMKRGSGKTVREEPGVAGPLRHWRGASVLGVLVWLSITPDGFKRCRFSEIYRW